MLVYQRVYIQNSLDNSDVTSHELEFLSVFAEFARRRNVVHVFFARGEELVASSGIGSCGTCHSETKGEKSALHSLESGISILCALLTLLVLEKARKIMAMWIPQTSIKHR